MERTLIYLVRHGEVDNPRGIRYGRLPGYRLSGRGREQASQAGRRIAAGGAPIREIVTSPLERAVETAELVAAELGNPPTTHDRRVIEASSVFDGLPRDAPKSPGQWRHLLNPVRPSWGESFQEVGNRMAGALFDLVRRHRGGAAVVVSHQSPIWLARLTLQGWRLPPWLAGPVQCHHASVSTLWFEGLRFVTWWYWRSDEPAG